MDGAVAGAEEGGSLSVPVRRALVTGASSGIGEAVARLLAANGYRLALLARREQELARVLAELPGETNAAHRAYPCDLRRPEEIRRAFAAVREDFGALDCLVNNAGIGYRARVEELDDDLVSDVLATNVAAVLFCCREALPLLRRGARPVVINVSSVVGRRGVPGQAVYSASKAAVCSIGEALRVEWADEDIAVCTLNAALTATGFFEAQANPSRLPAPDLSGAAGPEQVAEAVLDLDRSPRPERSMRWKWKLLGAFSAVLPRLGDRLLVRGIKGGWSLPRR